MTELILSGLELMLLGMGIVFVFLTILVFALHGMTWLSDKLYQPEPAEPPSQVKMVTNTSGAVGGAISAEHLAVISAAIARYRTARA